MRALIFLLSVFLLSGCNNSVDNDILTEQEINTPTEQNTIVELKTPKHDEEEELTSPIIDYTVNEFQIRQECFRERDRIKPGENYGDIILWSPDTYNLLRITDQPVFDFQLLLDENPRPIGDFLEISPDGMKLFFSYKHDEGNSKYQIKDLETSELYSVPWKESYDGAVWLNSDVLLIRDYESEQGLLYSWSQQTIKTVDLKHPNQIEISQGAFRLREYLLTEGFFINPTLDYGVFQNGSYHTVLWDIAQNKQVIEAPFDFLPLPLWNPNGKSVFVVTSMPTIDQRDLPRYRVSKSNREIIQIFLDGEIKQLTNFAELYPSGNSISPIHISPDGKYLIFLMKPELEESWELYLVDFKEEQITSTGIEFDYSYETVPIYWSSQKYILISSEEGEDLHARILLIDYQMREYLNLSEIYKLDRNAWPAGWVHLQ